MKKTLFIKNALYLSYKLLFLFNNLTNYSIYVLNIFQVAYIIKKLVVILKSQNLWLYNLLISFIYYAKILYISTLALLSLGLIGHHYGYIFILALTLVQLFNYQH